VAPWSANPRRDAARWQSTSAEQRASRAGTPLPLAIPSPRAGLPNLTVQLPPAGYLAYQQNVQQIGHGPMVAQNMQGLSPMPAAAMPSPGLDDMRLKESESMSPTSSKPLNQDQKDKLDARRARRCTLGFW
jgi:hypothetical protein